MKSLGLTGSLLMLVSVLCAQELSEKQVLARMNRTFIKAEAYSMDVKVDLFEKGKSAPYQSLKGQVRKDGLQYYSRIMQRITLRSASVFISVDEARKTIYYNRIEEAERGPADPADVMAGLDSSLKGSRLRFLGMNQGADRYYRLEILPETGHPYAKIEIVIGRDDYSLQQLVYYHKPDEEGNLPCEKTVITYSNVRMGVKPATAYFREENYIRKRAGGLEPSPAYAGFKVVDLRDVRYE